ncbi:MAG: hypothetical protein JO127_13675 [Caulobacteraceae bacterium]|nr:hypothetical protein [Caulobacteraceae bacterium]
MSATPDPAELAPSRDPTAYGRRRLFTTGFAVWAALCLACLIAGLLIGRFGVHIAPAAAPPASLADGAQRPAAPTPAPAVPLASAPLAPAGPASDQVSDRLARLEDARARETDAAAAALAAASLSEAAAAAAPFSQEVAAYQRLLPGSADLRALAQLAARGAPGRMALAASLPDLAAQAAAASRQPARGASLIGHLVAMIGRVVVVRRVDPGAGGVDGTLAAAEAKAGAGDLEDAVAALATLPPAARAPLNDWIGAAGRRIEIDRRIAALRAQALSDLVEVREAAP